MSEHDRKKRVQEIISGIIGGNYIKAGLLDREQIIKDLDAAYDDIEVEAKHDQP